MTANGFTQKRQLCANDRAHQECKLRGPAIARPFELRCHTSREDYVECSYRDMGGANTQRRRRELGQETSGE